jgi:hypothetical protein
MRKKASGSIDNRTGHRQKNPVIEKNRFYLDYKKKIMHSLTIICSTAIFLLSLNNIYCDKDTDTNALQQLINHMSEGDKKKIFQSLVQHSNEGRQDNTHWCCSIDPGEEFYSII